MAVSIERWKKNPREPPDGSAFKDGLAHRTVDEWLAVGTRRAPACTPITHQDCPESFRWLCV